MILEKEVEQKIARTLRERLGDDASVVIVGGWDVITSPDAAQERPGEAARVLVRVGAPVFDTYVAPTINLSVSIAIAVRRELDASGARFERVLGAVEDFCLSLQLSLDALESVSTYVFCADGASADGGGAPMFDGALEAWTVTRTLTLKGTVLQP